MKFKTTIEREGRQLRGDGIYDDIMTEVKIEVEYTILHSLDNSMRILSVIDTDSGEELTLTFSQEETIEAEAWRDNARNAIDVSGQAMEDAS